MKRIFRAHFQKTFGLALLLLVTTCVQFSSAQNTIQETFPSAEKAIQALFAAVESNDEQVIVQVLGGDKDLASSGDALEDQHDRALFVQKYRQMHRLVEEPDGTTLLYLGAENWPFPVPLVSKDSKWFFDAGAGADEILFRRIGENQAAAIDTCRELRTTGQVPSGVLHGYYFRKLVEPAKGKAEEVIYMAYPAAYRYSGVMTFAVTAKNVVFEKDLGPRTESLAKAMATWNADRSWRRAE
jgi:hypothetical protein